MFLVLTNRCTIVQGIMGLHCVGEFFGQCELGFAIIGYGILLGFGIKHYDFCSTPIRIVRPYVALSIDIQIPVVVVAEHPVHTLLVH